eukprot:scaffold7714_cov44-Prasinocladus_malaysianus.AAC.1
MEMENVSSDLSPMSRLSELDQANLSQPVAFGTSSRTVGIKPASSACSGNRHPFNQVADLTPSYELCRRTSASEGSTGRDTSLSAAPDRELMRYISCVSTAHQHILSSCLGVCGLSRASPSLSPAASESIFSDDAKAAGTGSCAYVEREGAHGAGWEPARTPRTTKLAGIRSKLDACQLSDLSEVVSFAPGLGTNKSNLLAAYEKYGAPKDMMMVVMTCARMLLGIGWLTAQTRKQAGLCNLRYILASSHAFIQLAVLPNGLLPSEWSNLLHLLENVWIGVMRLTLAASMQPQACDGLCPTDFEERLEPPLLDQPTLRHLLYWIAVETFVWAMQINLLTQVSVKVAAWSLLALFIGHNGARFLKISCLDNQSDAPEFYGCAMMELTCVVFAFSYLLILAGRLYMEERSLLRFASHQKAKLV